MEKFKKTILFCFLFSLIFTVQVRANENNGIVVKPILPENQYNKEVTYYDLRMNPNQKQELELELTNVSNVDERVMLEITDAITNEEGYLEYVNSKKDGQRDSSLKVALSDITEVPREAVVKANSTKIIKIKLNMPEKEFDGIIVGGVRVSEIKNDTKEQKDSKEMVVENKTVYTVGLNLSETDTELLPELKLLKVFPGEKDGHNVIMVNLQNDKAQVLEKIEYKAELREKGKKEVIGSQKVTDYRAAPNSSFNYPVPLDDQRLFAGEYTLLMTATSKDTNQAWNWEEDFTISESEAEQLNEKLSQSKKTGRYLWISVIVLLIIGVAVVCYYVYNKSVKDKKHKKTKKKKS